MDEHKNKSAKYILPFFRILVGLLFITSGIFKLINVEAFKYTLSSLNFFSPWITNAVTYFIPVFEVLLGFMLALGVFIRPALIHLNAAIILFIITTYYAITNNLNLSCGCFGSLWDMKFSWYHLITLALLFFLNIVLIIDNSDILSLERIIKNKMSQERKNTVLKIFLIVLITLGIILIIATMILNFTSMGNNIRSVKITDGSVETSVQALTAGEEEPEIKKITVDDAYLAYSSEKEYIFLDVRNSDEYKEGHIKAAILIPITELSGRLDEIPKNIPIIAYCNGSSCNRSGRAALILMKNGFSDVYDLAGGGIFEWIEKGYPYETGN